MSADLTPEVINAKAESNTLSLKEALRTDDVGAQPGPEEFKSDDLEPSADALATSLSLVKWPLHDKEAPDYAYLADEANPATFTLTADVLETLIALNRYEPYRDKKTIAFALRGAKIPQGHEVEMADSVELENVRPDHRHFRCVIGFYFTNTKKLTVFTGSTVPCRRAVWSYKNGGDASNMLPTGMHTFYIWRHKQIWPALRMGHSKTDPEKGAEATVLRNKNNYIIEMKDIFDLSTPYDNVHCSYYLGENDHLGARFSSWGCLTVRGERTPTEQWKKFQAVLDFLGKRERVDLLLSTGKDAALVAINQGDLATLLPKLTALRRGSRGPEVQRLQAQIGVDVTGFFGAKTLDRFTGVQRSFNNDAGAGPVADGIYTRAMDTATGWGIFGNENGQV